MSLVDNIVINTCSECHKPNEDYNFYQCDECDKINVCHNCVRVRFLLGIYICKCNECYDKIKEKEKK